MIEIDGSQLEGGGQILRTAISLSAITGKQVHIYNIRKGRENPGLKPQHLEGLNAAAKISRAMVEGAFKNSSEIIFSPGKIQGGKYYVDIRTAGAVTLVLQTLAPICLYTDAPSELSVKGGTAVPHSPTTEYFQYVFCGYLKKMGIALELETRRHGFYPTGGGEVVLKIHPAKLSVLSIPACGALEKVDVKAVAANHLRGSQVAERMIMGFQQLYPQAHFKYKYVDARSPGCFIRSHAHFHNATLGADALGKRGKRAEEVGNDAARELIEIIESRATVDSWMTDQIIPYLALAAFEREQVCTIKIPKLTRHAETNIWVTRQFLSVEFETRNNLLTCHP